MNDDGVIVSTQLAAANAGFVARAAEVGVDIPSRQTYGSLHVDVERYDVRLDDEIVELTPRQVELLALFMAAPDRLWTRAQLHAVCWGQGSAGRRVDVQLCRIRARLGLDLFRNIRDRGWALRAAS